MTKRVASEDWSPTARKRFSSLPHKTTPLYQKHLSKFGELRQCDPFHWQLRGDAILMDWWPAKGKWRIADRPLTVGDFKDMLRDLEAEKEAFRIAMNPTPEQSQ